MGLLDSLFGSSKKNVTTNTTQATQNTSNVSADGESILAGDGTSVSVDKSTDYRYTDSRDMSTHLVDSRDMSMTSLDYSTDARSYSTITYDPSVDVVSEALNFANNADARRSLDYGKSIDATYNASLEFFGQATSALRESYDANSEALADSNVRALNAVVDANRTDGQAIIDTVQKYGKWAALLIGAAIVFSAFKGA